MLPGQSETQIIPIDFQLNLDAATRLINHEALYPPTDQMESYQYPPVFALAIRPLLWMSPAANLTISFLLRLVGYAVLYIWWGRIFRRTKIRQAAEIWAWTLPIWLVFRVFWSDLAYMNIYIITAMFATLFIDAILSENLFLSVLWLTILLQTKPHWIFALAVPALLGRWRFFLRLLLGSIVVNTAVIAGFLLAVGPAYGWEQSVNYPRFLASLSSTFPWLTRDMGFMGYNHSILQIAVFLFGNSAGSFYLATVAKLLLLVPLAIICIRQLLHPIRRGGYEVPELALGLAFLLYLGVFISMDMVWELSLGCAVFAFLLVAHERERILRIIMWVVFMLYTLTDLWQIVSYAVFGDQIITENGYILTDYSIYIPMVMIVILVFYLVLTKRLWRLLSPERSARIHPGSPNASTDPGAYGSNHPAR
jgi:hypothetical protein